MFIRSKKKIWKQPNYLTTDDQFKNYVFIQRSIIEIFCFPLQPMSPPFSTFSTLFFITLCSGSLIFVNCIEQASLSSVFRLGLADGKHQQQIDVLIKVWKGRS